MSIFCPSALCNESGSVTTPGASHVLNASGPFPHSWDTWGEGRKRVARVSMSVTVRARILSLRDVWFLSMA